MKQCNLNEIVFIKLTDVGASIVNDYFNDERLRSLNTKVTYKQGDIFKSQLWLFCSIFGEDFRNNFGPFPANFGAIYFNDSSIKDCSSIDQFEKDFQEQLDEGFANHIKDTILDTLLPKSLRKMIEGE